MAIGVTLSTATPPGGAYFWNDSNTRKPVILSERSESKNPPKLGGTMLERRYSYPRGTLRLRSLGVCSAQGDMLGIFARG